MSETAKENLRISNNNWATNTRYKLRQAILTKYGNRCNNIDCRWVNEDGTVGCTEELALQVDHVFDDGYKHRYSNGRSAGASKFDAGKFYRMILSDTTGRFQLLCANCNWIKRGKRANRSIN
jgi:hypothetical protein